MPFIAECPFCCTKLRVPEHSLGQSIACPKCRSFITLAACSDQQDRTPLNENFNAGPVCETGPKPFPNSMSRSGSAMEGASAAPDLPFQQEASLGLASFCAGSAALLFATFAYLNYLTVPLSAVGALLGLVAVNGNPDGRPRGVAVSRAGLTVSGLTLIATLLWPTLFGWPPWFGGGASRPKAGETFAPTGIQAPPLVGGGQWPDASRSAILHGDVRLRVTSATVSNREPALRVGIQLTNVGGGRGIEYGKWGVNGSSQDESPAEIKDERNRTYRILADDAKGGAAGRGRPTVLRPGEAVEDVLRFEAPPADAEVLFLELPAAAFKGRGRARFAIPRSMIGAGTTLPERPPTQSALPLPFRSHRD